MNPFERLFSLARDVRERAYAPYSGYRVGAAIECADGSVWTGCNVENISFGLTICAERSALTAMVAGGQQSVVRVAVVTPDGGTPCGMCVQSLLEFGKQPETVEVWVGTPERVTAKYVLSELMPHSFRSAEVVRTSEGAGAVQED